LIIPVAADGSGRDGYIKIVVNYVGPDLNGTFNRAEQILTTLQLP
jgi:hypothetical protein